MRVTLSFTCESNFLSDASHTFIQMRVTLSFKCESHFLSHASRTFLHMRVKPSYRCELHFQMRVTLSFRCESHFLSDASHTFFQMRVKLFESEEETGVKVRRRLVWEWGGNWSISDYTQGTIRALKGMQARSTLVRISKLSLNSWCDSFSSNTSPWSRLRLLRDQGSRVSHTKHERTQYALTIRCSERTTYMVVSHVMQLVDFRLHAGHYSGSERNADM